MPATQEILDCPMGSNDADAATVGEYLRTLALNVWRHGERFNGKRPFGNSGWEWDVFVALGRAGLLDVPMDEYGQLPANFDEQAAHQLVADALRASELAAVR